MSEGIVEALTEANSKMAEAMRVQAQQTYEDLLLIDRLRALNTELREALEEIASLLEEDSFENDEEAIEIARAVLAKEKSDK